jgi:hypothetical protein
MKTTIFFTILVAGMLLAPTLIWFVSGNEENILTPMAATNITVGPFNFYWETTSSQGLHIYGLFLNNKDVVAQAYVHGIRYKTTAFGNAVDVDISSFSRSSLNYGAGSTGDISTSYYIEYVLTKSITNGNILLREKFEILNTTTGYFIFSLSFKWTNSGGGSMYSMEAFWKLDYDIPTYTTDICSEFDGTWDTQINNEAIVDPTSYTHIYFKDNTGQPSVIDMPSANISTPASTSSPSSYKWACIRDWENDHTLSLNSDGDNTNQDDIWGAWQIFNTAWTSGTWYGKSSNVYLLNY